MIRRLLLALLLVVPALAHAQANFLFNGAGAAIASGSSVAAQRAISGSAVVWSAGSSGFVATGRAAANAAIASQAGNSIRLTGAALTRVAANDLAVSALSGIRAGIPGVIASVAITAALIAAHEKWNGSTFGDNPDPVQAPGPGKPQFEYLPCPANADGSLNSCSFAYTFDAQTAADANCHHEFGSRCLGASAQSTAPYTVTETIEGTLRADGVRNPPQQLQRGLNYTIQPGDPQLACPNGVTYAGTCFKPITDDQAATQLQPKITTDNGPQIAADLTNNGAVVHGSELPQVNLDPASGPTTTTPNPNTNPLTQTQTHQDAIPHCVANSCAVSLQTTAVQLDANGNPLPNTSPQVTTATPGPDQSSPTDDNQSKSCGLDRGTACYINEEGTPPATTPLPHGDAFDAPATDRLSKLPNVVDSSTKDVSLPDSLLVPPLASCEPFVFPRDLGTVDPCPVVDDVRQVMDYVWGIAGLIAILGMVKRTMDGG